MAVGRDGRLYLGTDGSNNPGDTAGAVWRTVDPLPVVAGEEGPGWGADGARLEVRPNPAVGRVAAVLVLEEPAEVALAVYDALGREVAALPSRRVGESGHPFPLDTSGWAPGVYVVWAEVTTSRGKPHAVTQRFTVVR
jgi:hypothetical protein